MFMRKLMIYLFLFVWVTVVSAQNMDVEQSGPLSTNSSPVLGEVPKAEGYGNSQLSTLSSQLNLAKLLHEI